MTSPLNKTQFLCEMQDLRTAPQDVTKVPPLASVIRETPRDFPRLEDYNAGQFCPNSCLVRLTVNSISAPWSHKPFRFVGSHATFASLFYADRCVNSEPLFTSIRTGLTWILSTGYPSSPQ